MGIYNLIIITPKVKYVAPFAETCYKECTMQQLYKGLYSYFTGWEHIPTCYLRLVKTGNRYFVIATEIHYPLNRGVSVTFGCEALATQIVDEFHLDPDKTLFIEHWPELKDGGWIVYEESLDIVEFTWRKEFYLWGRKYASDPTWERIQPQQLLELVLFSKSGITSAKRNIAG